MILRKYIGNLKILNKIIVADAGPLIAFGCLNKISILTITLGTIIVPETVLHECTHDLSRPGAQAIQHAIQDQLITISTNPDNSLPALNKLLGLGESAAIRLAIELSCGLLVDDLLARNVAATLHLSTIGTIGVLLRAKQKSIIMEVLPIINDLKNVGYYLSDNIIREAANIAGEHTK
jgi:uncharacterized protein